MPCGDFCGGFSPQPAHLTIRSTTLAPVSSHRIKLEWAQAHLAALKEVTEALVKSQHYPAVTEFDANTGEHVVRLGRVPELPPEIVARVGDVLFNLRCSLDHLVYALSKEPRTCNEFEIAFPVVLTREKWPHALKRRIRDIPPAAQDVIESLQPYHRPEPEVDYLYGGPTPWISGMVGRALAPREPRHV